MQSLKDLALMVSKKKPKSKFFFFSNKEICPLSPLNMCKNQKQWFIYNLLGIFKNVTKFQLHQIRTQIFQWKLFDTAVTLTYNQGQWKWQEWVKLNEYYHHAQFDIYRIYSVQENSNAKGFTHMDTQLALHQSFHRQTFFMRVKNAQIGQRNY